MIDLHIPQTFKPTHQTGGLPGFPAVDVFGPAGAFVTAPEEGELVWPHLIPWDQTRRVGGWTCYYQGASGDTYFLTHFSSLRDRGTYHKGGVIGIVAAVPHSWWPTHIHEGKHKGRFTPVHT